MRAACALRISSGRIISNLQCWKICGFSSIAFSQEGVVAGNGIYRRQGRKKPRRAALRLRSGGKGDGFLLVVVLNADRDTDIALLVIALDNDADIRPIAVLLQADVVIGINVI